MKKSGALWFVSGIGLFFLHISLLFILLLFIFVVFTLYLAVQMDDKMTGRNASHTGSSLDRVQTRKAMTPKPVKDFP